MVAIRVTWWNLQNFFDTDDDPISRDFDYTRAAGWTPEAYAAKRANLAAALRATHDAQGPDLLAVAEIEKDSLLEELVAEMGGRPLRVVRDPLGTADLRGMDVAMAYDPEKLSLQGVASHRVHLRFPTRDILQAVFTIRETAETLVVFANHWPSRRQGVRESEPLRIALAENLAYLVHDHLKVGAAEYEALRQRRELEPVVAKWETKVLILGDFNDEPADLSVVRHLGASREWDRVAGPTNDITGFRSEVAAYRTQDVFLYNPMWRFLCQEDTGTFFYTGGPMGQRDVNRYQILDQIIVSRGLAGGLGTQLDRDSVSIFSDPLVATQRKRPRGFQRDTFKGTSDHLPVTAVLRG